MVDASHDKEARAKETIGQLKVEIGNLSNLVEQGAGLSHGQESTVNELLKARDDLTKGFMPSTAAAIALLNLVL